MNFSQEESFSKREKPKLRLQREILKQSFLKENSLHARLIKKAKYNAKRLLQLPPVQVKEQ
jgi:hypothetical protein